MIKDWSSKPDYGWLFQSKDWGWDFKPDFDWT